MDTTTLRMAWRNIWRNTRRTLITASAIGLGLATMIFYSGMQDGMRAHMVRAATQSYLGQAQIHATGYRETQDVAKTIPAADSVLAAARALPRVTAATPRVLATGLLAIGDRARGAALIGIDLATEPAVTDWQDRLLAGAYPSRADEVLLGRDMAEKLELEVGGKLVLTLAAESTGELQSLLLSVAGILYTGNPVLDENSAIVSLEPLREALGMPDAMHEIALRLDAPAEDEPLLNRVLAPLRGPGLEVLPWQELAPAMASLMDLQDFYLGLTILVVFAVIGLGIVNTLAMSLLERTWEFGVLRALGTSPWRLAGLIFAEAASLGVVGSVLGTIIGLGLHAYFSKHGLSLGGFQVAGVDFESRLYSILDPKTVVLMAVIFIVLTTLAGLSTAWRAARIDPARALREQ